MVDTTGRFLWVDGFGGMPDTLLGYPVIEMEDLPEIVTGNNAIVFGDISRAYTICDRIGVSVLYNPYLTAGFATYQARMRVGGVVTNTEAYKVLKIK
jgi:HK97 family phage major capsid protein